MKLDAIDLAILREIQNDSRLGNNMLAKRINLSQPATHSRLKKLKNKGIIRRFSVELDPPSLGLDMICFFHISLTLHSEDVINDFEKQICQFDEVTACYYLTGEFDYLVQGMFRNRMDLENFMRNRLSKLPNVSKVITSLVLSELKSTSVLPLTTGE